MKMFTIMLALILTGGLNANLFAAELLDVKPIIAGSSVSVEITADIAMTYTYYKVPGQPRAVVDIAEVDPEKIEPLIVVKKGMVSSISVDRAQISDLVVSRIIFNLASEADISVTASSDRKSLMVAFGDSAPVEAAAGIKAESKPEVKTEMISEKVMAKEPATAASKAAAPDEDPLELDEPAAKPVATPAKAVTAATTGAAALSAAPTVTRIPKLEPVVPVMTRTQTPLMIKEIVTIGSAVEILTNQSVSDYKTMKLSNPDRLVIDLPCDKTDQKPQITAINKFGISKVRIGVYPKSIRIVLDSSEAGFPAHTVAKAEYGVRITFK